jgi:hypothetical protein
MFVPLILLYFSITLASGILIFLIIKYFQDKPCGTQVITDRLIIHLLTAVFTGIAYLSSVITFKEVFGPLTNSVSTKAVLFVQQFIHSGVLLCFLSIQVAHFSTVFLSDR